MIAKIAAKMLQSRAGLGDFFRPGVSHSAGHPAHTHVHTYTYMHWHAHTHAHTHTDTDRHTHTHTEYVCNSMFLADSKQKYVCMYSNIGIIVTWTHHMNPIVAASFHFTYGYKLYN